MDEKITTLYADYRQGRTNRRDFVRKLAMVAGSTTAALALIPVLEANSMGASRSDQANPDLNTEFIKYQGETGEMKAFQAWPKSGASDFS